MHNSESWRDGYDRWKTTAPEDDGDRPERPEPEYDTDRDDFWGNYDKLVFVCDPCECGGSDTCPRCNP